MKPETVLFRGTPDVLIMSIVGELERMSGSADEMNKVIEKESGKDAIINISALDYLDSYGISILIRLRKTVEGNGGRFSLCSPGSYVKRILNVAGMFTYFNIYECEDDAINALAETRGSIEGEIRTWGIESSLEKEGAENTAQS